MNKSKIHIKMMHFYLYFSFSMCKKCMWNNTGHFQIKGWKNFFHTGKHDMESLCSFFNWGQWTSPSPRNAP